MQIMRAQWSLYAVAAVLGMFASARVLHPIQQGTSSQTGFTWLQNRRLACDGGECVPESSCKLAPSALRVAVSGLWPNAGRTDFFEYPRHALWQTLGKALCFPRIIIAQDNPDIVLQGIYLPRELTFASMEAARRQGIPVVLILSEPDFVTRTMMGYGPKGQDAAGDALVDALRSLADLVLGFAPDRPGRVQDPGAQLGSVMYLPEALTHTLHSAQRMRLAGTFAHRLPLDWVRRHKRRFASGLLGHDTADGRRSLALRALQAAWEDAGGYPREQGVSAGDWEWAGLPPAMEDGGRSASLGTPMSALEAEREGRWERPQVQDVAEQIAGTGLPRGREGLSGSLRVRWAQWAARGALLGETMTAPGLGYAPLAPAVDLPSAYMRTWPGIGQRAWHKDEFVRGRCFDIAIESSQWDRQYVSEKVLDSSFAGSIPVYSGGSMPPLPMLLRGNRMVLLPWGQGQQGAAHGGEVEETVRRAIGALWRDRDGALLQVLQRPVFQEGGRAWLCERMRTLSSSLTVLLQRSAPLQRRLRLGGVALLGDSREAKRACEGASSGHGAALDASCRAALLLLGGEVDAPAEGWDAPLMDEMPPLCFGPRCLDIVMQPMGAEAKQSALVEAFAFRVLHGRGRSALK